MMYRSFLRRKIILRKIYCVHHFQDNQFSFSSFVVNFFDPFTECSSFSRPVFTAALTIRDTLQRSGVTLNQSYTAPIMSAALKTN